MDKVEKLANPSSTHKGEAAIRPDRHTVVTSVFPLRLLMDRLEGNPCFLDGSVQTLVEIFSHGSFQSGGSKIALSALIPARLTHGHACRIFGLSFHLV